MSPVTPAGLEALRQAVKRGGYTYVGLADCKCIRGVVVDQEEIKDLIASALSKWILAGYTVERWPTEKVRETEWRCGSDTCPFHAHKSQLELTEDSRA